MKMNGKNQVKSLAKDFCKDGYIENQQYELLAGISSQYNITELELETIINKELTTVKEKQLETIYRLLDQPNAAVHDIIETNAEDIRRFPDLINIGKLNMELNTDVKSAALVPINDIAGICCIHDNDPSKSLNIIQNLSIRLGLSIPPKKFHFTLIDIENSGMSFKFLSDLDENIYTLIDEIKEVEKFMDFTRKESTSLVFKELGNKYTSYAEYFANNKTNASGYKIILVSGFPENPSPELVVSVQKLIKIAINSGVFFLISMDKEYLKQNPIIKRTIDENMFVYDLAKSTCSSLNEDINLWYNKIYTITPQTIIDFNENTKFKINQEYSPVKYKIKAQSTHSSIWNELSDEKILINLNSSATKGSLKLFLNDEKEDLWIFSDNEKENDILNYQIINELVKLYSPNEIQLSISGCEIELVDNLKSLPHISNLITENTGVYLLGLMEYIESEIRNREKLFTDTGIDGVNYKEFRKTSNIELPRHIIFINKLHKALNNSTDQFSNYLIDRFGKLINSCNQYGIHLIVSSEPIESLLLFDLSFFSYSILLNNKVEQVELFTNLDLNHINIFNAPGMGLFINKTNNQFEELELNDAAAKELQTTIEKLKDNDNNRFEKKPLIFSSNNNISLLSSTKIEKNILDDDSICLNIGKPNWFSYSENYVLTLPNQSDGNVLISGNDNESLISITNSIILQSTDCIDITLININDFIKEEVSIINNNPLSKRNEIQQYLLNNLDTANSNNDAPNIFGIAKEQKPSICFIYGIDTMLDNEEDAELINLITTFIEISSDQNIHIILNSNEESVFNEENLGTLSKITFGTQIICMESNEDLLNPIITMDGKLTIPKNNRKVLIDTPGKQSKFSADPVILYVNN